jgi:hypothetical protein
MTKKDMFGKHFLKRAYDLFLLAYSLFVKRFLETYELITYSLSFFLLILHLTFYLQNINKY